MIHFRSFKSFIMALALVVTWGFMSGCATTNSGTPASDTETWQTQARYYYATTGVVLTTLKTGLEVAKNTGVIDDGDYAKYADIYIQAKAVYDALGAALETAIAATNAAEKEGAFAAYAAAMGKMTELVPKITAAVAAINKE